MPRPEDVFNVAHDLLEVPVGHSAQSDGFWIVSDRTQCLAVLQDASTFQVGGPDRAVRIPADPPGFNRPLMPPQDANPPLHRGFRQLINPYLTPRALEPFDEKFRTTIAGLIEAFVPAGRVEIVQELGSVFPSTITFRYLFGIDDDVHSSRSTAGSVGLCTADSTRAAPTWLFFRTNGTTGPTISSIAVERSAETMFSTHCYSEQSMAVRCVTMRSPRRSAGAHARRVHDHFGRDMQS